MTATAAAQLFPNGKSSQTKPGSLKLWFVCGGLEFLKVVESGLEILITEYNRDPSFEMTKERFKHEIRFLATLFVLEWIEWRDNIIAGVQTPQLSTVAVVKGLGLVELN